MDAVSSLTLYSTNRLSNRYGQVFGWGLIEGGPFEDYSIRERLLLRCIRLLRAKKDID